LRRRGWPASLNYCALDKITRSEKPDAWRASSRTSVFLCSSSSDCGKASEAVVSVFLLGFDVTPGVDRWLAEA
jgi:hypothetical protein